MKRSKSVKLVLMGASGFALSACGDSDIGPGYYSSPRDCTDERVFTVDFCYDNFDEAQRMRSQLNASDGNFQNDEIDIDYYKRSSRGKYKKSSGSSTRRNGFGSGWGFSFGG